MKSEELYKMKIGEKSEDSLKIVERVPGGWNYIYKFNDQMFGVHVPFSNIDKPKKPKQTTIELSLEERKDYFKNQVVKICKEKKYDPITIGKSFFNWWTEHDENSKLMRFELKENKPFQIGSRLYTWSQKDFNKKHKQPEEVNPVKKRMN